MPLHTNRRFVHCDNMSASGIWHEKSVEEAILFGKHMFTKTISMLRYLFVGHKGVLDFKFKYII